MKKSKKQPPKKQPKTLPINVILEDMENLYKILGDINKTKLEDLDIDKITSKVNVFEKKYKDILPEDPKDNLDTKK